MDFSLWNYGRIYCSIEHRTVSDDDVSFFALKSRKKRGEFETTENFRSGSLSEISEKFRPGQHCYITITGNAILIKATTTSGTENKIIGAAFPNIDIDDFYYQILKTSEVNFVALCRKDKVQNILEGYRRANLNIIGFSLGFLPVQHLLGLVDLDEFQVSNYQIRKKNSEIAAFEKKVENEEKEYSIGDTTVNSQFLLPLSGLFNYEIMIPNSTSNIEVKNNELRTNHQQKVFFKKGSLVGAGLLFFALLINFFIFSQFHAEYLELKTQHQGNLLQKKIWDKKNKEIEEKEQMVANILTNSNSNSSFYINRIISEKPASVLLNEFNFHPLEKKIKETAPIELDHEVIKVVGESKNEVLFSEWIKDLEEISWIARVTVSNYSFLNTEASEFSLDLKIKESGEN